MSIKYPLPEISPQLVSSILKYVKGKIDNNPKNPSIEVRAKG